MVGEKRVGRLMKQEGIWGASRRRRGPKTTRRNADARPVVDLVERNFTADGPDQLWVADITYIPASAGFLYLAVVLDAWSRRVIGWAMATHLRTELVLDSLNMAVWQRRPERVIHHSDQGTQGEFKRSSQHLEEELRWRQSGAEERIELYVDGCVHQAVRRWDAASIGRGSGKRSLEVCRARRLPWRQVCPPLSGRFRPKDELPPSDGTRNPDVNFRGEKRSNETHRSTTDPDARLAKKARGKESKLSCRANVLMENRNGLIVQTQLLHSTGTAECEAVLARVDRLPKGKRRRTLGADKGYDTRAFVAGVRARGVTPHVAQNTANRRSAIDGRTTRHGGYAVSQKKRKLVEQGFGWKKSVGLLRKLRHRGIERVEWIYTFTSAAFNLVRMRSLLLEAVSP